MKPIVMITGGAGFLAQHLIRELQTDFSTDIAEIRIVDINPFRKIIDWPDNIPISHMIVDCKDSTGIERAISGRAPGCVYPNQVPSVAFHLAARMHSWTMYEDRRQLFEDNITGVQVVLDAMVKYGVEYLIYVSDSLAVCHDCDVVAPSEIFTMDGPKNGNFWFGPYAESKFQGELLARKANLSMLNNGKLMKTAVVRPALIYGEADSVIVPHVLRLCKQYGQLPRIGYDGNVAILQFVYAGNVAHMLTLLWTSLVKDPSSFAGEVFFCNEFTPPINFYTFIDPFVRSAGYSITNWALPYDLIFRVQFFVDLFFRFLNVFGLRFDHNLPDYRVTRAVAGWQICFDATKARLLLNYKPKYDPETGMDRTVKWWNENWENEK